ncbi:hypothetical protein NNC19_20310 [Clostridium sp. SHJSY1]|uniref:hypothetical protein n=1 Tax=Clostridium sp. SHJSY1 TaxID=2942483 RepID=UPI0028752E46|nr:hypothetical protein [Clostridium sp. SHJSY1]MDS0528041.1 hypothetical protein [Clostridium sp. SHJSY1]
MKNIKRKLNLLIIILLILLTSLPILKLIKKTYSVTTMGNIVSDTDDNKNETSDTNTDKDKDNDKSAETTKAILEALNSNTKSPSYESKDLRKFPYPYKSMLAICSDIDDTTLEEFETYHKFLNTKEQTPYGEGVGLDIGDSMWMYMGNDTKGKVDKYGNGSENIMTYYKGTDTSQKHNANKIVNYINSGWIDCLHTFGDFSKDSEKGTAFNRDLAVNAWNELKGINANFKVWINHGNRANVQNFGAHGASNFMSYQCGDNPKSPYYHTDLTMGNGVKYIWNSLQDSSFGHDYPLYELSLVDGKKVWGFHRYNRGLVNGKDDWTWNTKNLHLQLTQNNLDTLVKNQQYSIVAQHFGIGAEELFSQENINSLRMLANYQTNGKILVAKTSRLLSYSTAQKHIQYSKGKVNDQEYINIDCINDTIFGKSTPSIDDLRGITFYCDNPEKTVLLINKNVVKSDEIQINPKDETGKASITIKWFKSDYNDYTK